MHQPKQNRRLRILGGIMVGTTLCLSTTTLATALEEHGWAKPMLMPGHVRQESIARHHFDEDFTSCCNVVWRDNLYYSQWELGQVVRVARSPALYYPQTNEEPFFG